jgi:DNA replication protein DnaC
MTQTDLRPQLRALGLTHLAAHFDDVVATATKRRWTHVQLFEQITQLEHDERARRGLLRRTKRARLGRFKSMADFDWNWPSNIDRDAVESALRLDFLDKTRNVVLVAAQGLGKTMIAQNIAHQAVLAGHSVLFVTAAQMLLDLAAQDSARTLDRRLKYYARVGCLVVDELGLPVLRQPERGPALPSAVTSIREKEPRAHDQPRVFILAVDPSERDLGDGAHRPRRAPRGRDQDRGGQLSPTRGRGEEGRAAK